MLQPFLVPPSETPAMVLTYWAPATGQALCSALNSAHHLVPPSAQPYAVATISAHFAEEETEAQVHLNKPGWVTEEAGCRPCAWAFSHCSVPPQSRFGKSRGRMVECQALGSTWVTALEGHRDQAQRGRGRSQRSRGQHPARTQDWVNFSEPGVPGAAQPSGHPRIKMMWLRWPRPEPSRATPGRRGPQHRKPRPEQSLPCSARPPSRGGFLSDVDGPSIRGPRHKPQRPDCGTCLGLKELVP